MRETRHSPTVRGRQLRTKLEELRKAVGLTQRQVADELGWSQAKVIRIEGGKSRVALHDLEDLLTLYKVTSPEVRDSLRQLARDALRRGWWARYGDVFSGAFIGLEAESSVLRINAPLQVPDLLQTEEYARAFITATRPDMDPSRVDRFISGRMARQENLIKRPQPPSIQVVLDEGALRRQIGGPQIMDRQLAALIERGQADHVSIRVIPFSAGGHAGLDGEFVLIFFPDEEDPPVGYVEGLFGDVYVEESNLDRYINAWGNMLVQALDPPESTALIEGLRKEGPAV